MIKPWDQRLAACIVRPLVNTPVSPNVITALSLVLGISGAWSFAVGETALGGTLFIVALFADHADGELARLASKTTSFGHYFDRTAAAINYTAIFFGMGLAVDASWGPLAGLWAGITVAGVLGLRNVGAYAVGSGFMKQASGRGFETEDVMYIIGPLGWLDLQGWLVGAAAIGAPIYLLFTAFRLLRR